MREPRTCLWDAQAALERIHRFTAGRTFDDDLADDMLRSAVERPFEIVGEALGALRRVAPEVAAEVPHIVRIIAFRNVLIHEYASVDHRLVWSVVEQHLGALEHALGTLLDEGG